ncbi:unnamed protein product [Mytilus coruscus]|uniref:Ig-like domain-containing protein n=1 Tax=Mytilus coruscus TaxID=42192 RepID=A0A6J8EDD2_MYTCO|nr:unnamed protein product [Mytilus coruscus]
MASRTTEGKRQIQVNVTWNMKTNPAIIGNNVILECVISGEEQSCDEYPRQWYGGVNYGLLCEDGMCRYNKKYKELNISSCIYRLMIHNFTEQDLNQNYTCSYGIFKERKGLTLKDGPFQLHHWVPLDEHITELPRRRSAIKILRNNYCWNSHMCWCNGVCIRRCKLFCSVSPSTPWFGMQR